MLSASDTKYELKGYWETLRSSLRSLEYTNFEDKERVTKELEKVLPKMRTVRDHSEFPNITINGSHEEFEEVWEILTEYGNVWNESLEGGIPLIEEDWQSQTKQLHKIYRMTRKVRVL